MDVNTLYFPTKLNAVTLFYTLGMQLLLQLLRISGTQLGTLYTFASLVARMLVFLDLPPSSDDTDGARSL